MSDNQLRAEEDARAALISAVRYDLSLSLSADDGAVFGSRTVIDFDCATAGAATFVNLAAARLREVVLNDRALDRAEHGFDGRRLRVPGLRSGANRLVVDAECAYGRAGVGLHRFIDPVDRAVYMYTHFEPFDAHRVLACFDQPNIKAPLTLRVTAPAPWTVLANSAGTTRADESDTATWEFEATPPLPPYLYVVAAGEYDVIEGPAYRGTRLLLACRRTLSHLLRAQAGEIFDVTARGLAHFEERYGHRYPFGPYAQVFVPECTMGAMEQPGCVTFNELYIHRGPVSQVQRTRRCNVILHEMVHVMGFGDVVTMRDWGDLWLNETFATVEATLAADALGIPGAWVDFAGAVKSRALHQDQLSTTHPVLVDAPDTDSIRANFDGITYQKGASVLRQLVAWVGAEPYEAGIRAYFSEFFWGNATRADFLGHQSRASGRDLAPWARAWLETAGVNTLIPELSVSGDRYESVAVRQLADAAAGILRPHHVRVALYDDDGNRLRRRTASAAEVTGALTHVEALAGELLAPLVIVNDEDLGYVKLRFDPASLETLLAGGLSRLDADHARAQCWTALHDMTRGAELDAASFVSSVVAQAASETNDLVLERVLAAAVAVAERLTSAANHRPALAVLANLAADQLSRSRSPLIWARCLAASARESEQLALLERMLTGGHEVRGLDVDDDLRWLALARLATEGRAGPVEIDAQLERDPTDSGQRRAAACLTARPAADAKDEAWSMAFDDRPLSRAHLATALGGFTAGLFTAGGFHAGGRDQAALTGPFVDRVLEAVPSVWAERDYEVARVITDSLFPHEPADGPTIAAVEAVIARPGLPVTARRALLEGRDALVRARDARAVDVAG